MLGCHHGNNNNFVFGWYSGETLVIFYRTVRGNLGRKINAKTAMYRIDVVAGCICVFYEVVCSGATMATTTILFWVVFWGNVSDILSTAGGNE